MKRIWKVAAIAAATSLIVAACSDDKDSTDTTGGSDTTAAESTDIKVAVVYIGVPGDAGWTYQHDQGIAELEKNLGIEVKRVENIPDNADSQKTYEQLAADGYDLIFGTSFGYGDPMLAVAANYPDTCFEWATGYKTAENLGTYFGAAEEARYLTGLAAGKATQNGKIGYVAAFPIPEVLRGINAFTIGVREVNPEATVQVQWTKTWFDPTLEGEAAQALVDAGVDVLAQHQDSTATGEVAKNAGIKWAGYNSDTSSFAPEAWLTAPTWDWGPYYTQTAEAVAAGTCPTDQYYGTMADGMVTLASFGDSVDADTQAMIEEKKQAIIDGTFAPFSGPLNNQDGTQILAEGESATLDQLLGMDFFVEGVIGSATGE
jgi:basic membrane protein A and related proteins